MKQNDLVTIVTVTYNAESLLEETIRSVIRQSYDNIEYIIIDGASTDSTIDIIKKYEVHIAYWVSEPDDGLYFAMNKGIEKSTGKWINFMNAGDAFASDESVSQMMRGKTETCEMLYANFKKKTEGNVVKAQPYDKWFTTMPFSHQTLFAKTRLMKHYPFNTDYRIAADLDFIWRMVLQNRKFCHINETIAIFLEGGLAHSNTVEMCLESFRALLENNIAVENLMASSWYRYLLNDKNTHDKMVFSEIFITQIERLQKEKSTIEEEYGSIKGLLYELSETTTWKNPWKKFRLYKKLLEQYHRIK